MAKDQKEWFRQADYDMSAAQTLFDGRRYIYSVFMCHLSIEKALKGLLFKKSGKQPPKTHNLLFLIKEAGIDLPEGLSDFIFKLNRESVVTRYPEDIRRMSKDYNAKNVLEIQNNSKEVLEWLRKEL